MRRLALIVLTVPIAACGTATADRPMTSTVAPASPPRSSTTVASITTASDPAIAPATTAAEPTKVVVASDSTAPTPAAKPKRKVVLPVDSPWSLPPIVVAATRGSEASSSLRSRVLHSERLVFAPAARRAVERGSVGTGALLLLERLPRVPTPVIVHGVSLKGVRAQATTLDFTRTIVGGLLELPKAERPDRILFEPAPSTDKTGPPKPTAGQLETLIPIYKAAGARHGIDWRILAAINRVETNLGTNLNVSSAGAVGWMQFMPATWRSFGRDGNGDGVADPWNPEDAIESAALYLEVHGARTSLYRAIFAYNHADWYVKKVLAEAERLPA